MNKTLILTATLLCVSMMTGCNESKSIVKNPLNISIMHVNDVHSHLDSETMKLSFDGVSTYTQVGGYARMKTKIDALQASKPNSLTLNAGDVFQGTLYYSLFKGEADAAPSHGMDMN